MTASYTIESLFEFSRVCRAVRAIGLESQAASFPNCAEAVPFEGSLGPTT